MNLTELQDQVMTEAKKVRDNLYPNLALCMDLFKPQEDLGSDAKIEKIGIEDAARHILDDSLFWAGNFDLEVSNDVEEW